MPFYAVHPKGSVGPIKAGEIEAYLKNISGTDPIRDRGENRYISWRVSLGNESHVEEIHKREEIDKVQEIDEELYRRGPAEPQKKWLVVAKDPMNKEQLASTKQWLDSKVVDRNVRIWDYTKKKTGGLIFWGGVTLDDAGVEEARKREDVSEVVRDYDPEGTRAVLAQEPNTTEPIAKRSKQMAKRADLKWVKQEDAARDLVMDSQYKGSELGNDFVYEERAGEGTFVYIVDAGIELRVKDERDREEFAHYILNGEDEDFQTGPSKEIGQDGNTDSSLLPRGHGTQMASKALGRNYGVAKGATLISVKTTHSGSIIEGFELILEDLSEFHPERAGKSVVMMSMVIAEEIFSSPEEARKDVLGIQFTDLFNDIMDLGVPIVVSAGNYGDKGRKDIDNVPPILEGPDLPLMVIGGATESGERAPFSQEGNQVALYGPGVNVKCRAKDGSTQDDGGGTSVAVPIVAGVIATYLNYDPLPWDSGKKGKDRVRAIRDFIKSDASSWERKPGIRMIWNGADENAHKDATPVICKRDGQCPTKPSPSPQPSTTPQYSRECNKIENKKYIIEHKISDLINNHFCPAAVSQGKHDDGTQSFARSYNIGTTEEVDLAIDWPSNLQDFKPNMDDCKHYLHDLIRYCDYEFPMAWKAGGNVHFGPVVYRFSTKNVRQYPMPKPWSTCEVIHDQPTSRSPVTLKFNIGGAGWMNSDFGQGMKDGLGNLKSWNFKYELGSDGREWTAKFDVMNGKSVTDVQDLARKVVGDGGFAMHCKLKT